MPIIPRVRIPDTHDMHHTCYHDQHVKDLVTPKPDVKLPRPGALRESRDKEKCRNTIHQCLSEPVRHPRPLPHPLPAVQPDPVAYGYEAR